MRRYLILGAGAAGIGAAETIRQHDPTGEIILLSDDPYGYYSRPGLAYYLTCEIPEELLFPFKSHDFERLGLQLVHGRAERIDPAAHQVIYRPHAGQSAALAYDSLLIATGASASPLNAPGGDRPGVVKLDNLHDARLILSLAKKARSAVVVGGGITALELVEGLIQSRVKVHYLLRGDRYWSNVLDEAESRLVEKRLRHHGVILHFNSEIAEVIGRPARSGLFGMGKSDQPADAAAPVHAVRTKDGQTLPCDLLAFAIGVRPRKELAETSGLRCERGVLADEYMRTSAVDVFAAGDVAQVFDPLSGKSVIDSLWAPARDQGRTAGRNMAIGHTQGYLPYRKSAAFNVTRLAGLTTTIIGMVSQGVDPDLGGDRLSIARGDSETWRQLPDAIAAQTGFDINHMRLLIGEHSLLGAVLIGDQTLSLPLQHIVADQRDISPIRQRLLAGQEPLADVIAEFWSEGKA